jgi:dTMP kinase
VKVHFVRKGQEYKVETKSLAAGKTSASRYILCRKGKSKSMQTKPRGKLIVIEGLDGAGKTTQWEMLKQSPAINPQTLFLTFPDYDSESGKIIKRYLAGEFENAEQTVSAFSASSFYAIDRYISYSNLWGKSYRNGTDIISARYTSSNAIYQMTKLPENEWQNYLDWLYDYEYNKLGIPEPYLTIFLDVPVEISQELLSKRYADAGKGVKDIHEGDAQYLRECRKAAIYAAKRDNWVKIDCVKLGNLRTPEDINRELVAIIGDILNDRI